MHCIAPHAARPRHKSDGIRTHLFSSHYSLDFFLTTSPGSRREKICPWSILAARNPRDGEVIEEDVTSEWDGESERDGESDFEEEEDVGETGTLECNGVFTFEDIGETGTLEFTLKLGVPTADKNRASYDCNNSDGLHYCNCVGYYFQSPLKHHAKKCRFFGRPIEPLAFYLPPFSAVDQQKQCPLFGVLPKEIRDLVWEFALTHNDSSPYHMDFVRNKRPVVEWGKEKSLEAVEVIPVALLQTCKAVYLETYRLPMLLNGFLHHQCFRGNLPHLEKISPWQYALIQGLDMRLQQATLEGNFVYMIEDWGPWLRHAGAYVSPRFYSPRFYTSQKFDIRQGPYPHGFDVVTSPKDGDNHLQDGDKITLPYEDTHCLEALPPSFRLSARRMEARTMVVRAMVARPLTRLTIRMSKTDWWTWADHPRTTDSEQQLALDPTYGTEEGKEHSRPRKTDMLRLAAERRAGQYPTYGRYLWGAAIRALPDLKTLEFVLETFSVKKHQLEVVVDCATTWRFPLKDTRYEMVWDGKVEEYRWPQAPDPEDDWVMDSEFGSEDMDRESVDSPADWNEDNESREGVMRSDQEGESVDDEQNRVVESDHKGAFFNHAWLPDENSTISHEEEEDGGDNEDSDSDFNTRGDWYAEATEFEDRIVRFARRRAD